MVDYYTEDGTAESGSDYVPVKGTLTFYPEDKHQVANLVSSKLKCHIFWYLDYVLVIYLFPGNPFIEEQVRELCFMNGSNVIRTGSNC